ncbi:MAG: response regulator transcription factor [Bacteroidetes bacterium]|nr:response regulator transcription factor [Bacteroidota bacterium]
MKKILIIDDDPVILQGLSISLEEEHYESITCDDGEEGLAIAEKDKFDLIILDLMLPNKNGVEICKDLRSKNIQTPILMLTCKKEEMDKVLGLEIGADDYMTNPFSTRELLARVKAILRRKKEYEGEVETFSFSDVKLDFQKLEAYKSGVQIDLSVMEFKILKFFIKKIGTVISRDMFLDEISFTVKLHFHDNNMKRNPYHVIVI